MGLVGIGLASAPRDSSKTANAKYRCAPAAVDTDGARVGVSAGGVRITTKISALPGQPVVHAHGIGSRGKWIPGLLDPTANGRSQSDGFNLLQIYRNLGWIWMWPWTRNRAGYVTFCSACDQAD